MGGHPHGRKQSPLGVNVGSLSDLQITEVKNYFNEHKKQLEEQAQKIQAQKKDDNFPEGLPVLFGGVNPPEFAELLGSLPKRLITDKLVHRYFNSFDPSIRE